MEKKLNLFEELLNLGFKNYQDLYIEWDNHFSTFEEFADRYNIDYHIAVKLINNAIWLYEDYKGLSL